MKSLSELCVSFAFFARNIFTQRFSQSIAKVFLTLSLLAFIPQEYKLIKTIPINGKFLTTDNLNNAYVITDANELIKLDANGEKLFSYSEKNFGELSFVDASNPLKILVFFPQYSTVITLDKTLSPLGTYNLRNAGITRMNSVCLSQDNNIWIFDEQDFKLKKLDENLKVVRESDDVSLIINNSLKPNFLIERNNWIFLNDPQIGILQFDSYSTYFKTIPIKNLQNFQVLDDRIFYFEKNSLQSFQIQTSETQTASLPDTTNLVQTRIEKNSLYLLKKNELVLYSF